MARKWDIVEVTEPEIGVTAVNPDRDQQQNNGRKKQRVAGALASTVCTIAIAVGTVGAFGATKPLQESFAFAGTTNLVKIPMKRHARVAQNSLSDTDSQVGMSTRRLAKVKPAFFKPAEDEPTHETNYSFF